MPISFHLILKNNLMQQFKIRCSAISEIMGEVNRPTDKQLAELARLEGLEKRTEKQDITLKELIARRDAKPQLSVGAKNYCKKWLKQQPEIFNRRREFSNRYTEKGTLCEPQSLIDIAEANGYANSIKNEQQFENEFIIGTPDLLQPDIVDDAKNSWDTDTFPLFEDEIPDKKYEWQIDGYMDLTGRKKGAVNYCLTNAPEFLISRAARQQSFAAGFDEEQYEIYEEVKQKMTYDDIPKELKIKRFEFDRDEKAIAQIYEQVRLCRIYIQDVLLPKIKVFRTGEIPVNPKVLAARQELAALDNKLEMQKNGSTPQELFP